MQEDRPALREAQASDERQLWQRYRKEGDLTARDRLVERHMPLVRSEARKFHRRTSGEVQYDDLLSAGGVGLLQALERFDPDRGWRISTFAMQRVRGAILDHLRQNSGVPRRTLVRTRKMAMARASVENRVGRRAKESEVAEELGVAPREYRTWQADCVRVSVPLNDEVAGYESGSDWQGGESGPAWLTEAIDKLPAREHTVIMLGFYEGVPQGEIAKVLGVSESRVSQLRTRALSRLRSIGQLAVAV